MFNSYKFEKWQSLQKQAKEASKHSEIIGSMHKKRSKIMAFQFKKNILSFLSKV